MIKYVLASLMFLPMPSLAQQVTEFKVCTKYRETYTPGYYDNYGNYIQGRVSSESYQVKCGRKKRVHRHYHHDHHEHHNHNHGHAENRASCDPTRTLLGATLGGGIGAALSRDDGRYWAIPVGAFIGGAGIGC